MCVEIKFWFLAQARSVKKQKIFVRFALFRKNAKITPFLQKNLKKWIFTSIFSTNYRKTIYKPNEGMVRKSIKKVPNISLTKF